MMTPSTWETRIVHPWFDPINTGNTFSAPMDLIFLHDAPHGRRHSYRFLGPGIEPGSSK